MRGATITGFVIVSGDRNSFWAGYAAKALPPKPFEPVGLSFVGASLSSPGTMEAYEHRFPKDDPLRALFLADRASSGSEWTHNMLMRHGVRSCLEYAKSGDKAKALALSNPSLAPHLEFLDLERTRAREGAAVRGRDAHGVRAHLAPGDAQRSPRRRPLRYRVVHVASLWRAGERLRQEVLEGDPGLSI
jgi:alkaline phosphatase D